MGVGVPVGDWLSGKAAPPNRNEEQIKEAQRRLEKAARELNQPHSVNSLLEAKRKHRLAEEALDKLKGAAE